MANVFTTANVATGRAHVTPTPVYNAGSSSIDHDRISWRAIFAGLFVALLSYMTLMALGVAIGGSVLVGIVQGGDGQGLSIGAGIWVVIAGLASLFFGAYMAGRVSGRMPTRIGAVQGLVITALFFAFMLSQIGAGIGLLGRGVGGVVGAAGSAASDVASNPQVQNIVEDSIGDLNLRQEPTVVAQGVVSRLIRGDSESARNYLALQAGISPDEAQARLDTFSDRFSQTMTDIGTTASRVLAIAGWVLFGSMFLGSIFAAMGGAVGTRKNLRHLVSDKDQETVVESQPRSAA